MDLVTMLGLHRTQVQSSCLSGGLDLAAQLGRWLPPGRGDCANGPEAGLTPIFPLLPMVKTGHNPCLDNRNVHSICLESSRSDIGLLVEVAV